ncbi:hypothetical protein Tco_0617278 [Tanacetum coccineum]
MSDRHMALREIFLGATSVLDGTLVHAIVPINEQTAYRGRGCGGFYQNILGICDFDMIFIFVGPDGKDKKETHPQQESWATGERKSKHSESKERDSRRTIRGIVLRKEPPQPFEKKCTVQCKETRYPQTSIFLRSKECTLSSLNTKFYYLRIDTPLKKLTGSISIS